MRTSTRICHGHTGITTVSTSVRPPTLSSLANAIHAAARLTMLTFAVHRLGCPRELRGCSQDRFVNMRRSDARWNSVADFVRCVTRPRKVQRGLRGHQRGQLSEVCHQGSQACQEEEDQARDQDPPEPGWRAQHRRASGRRSRLAGDYIPSL